MNLTSEKFNDYFFKIITMRIEVQRRAEIAIRSLQQRDRMQIERAISELKIVDSNALMDSDKAQILLVGRDQKQLIIYKASLKFRLVLTFFEGSYILQDVIDSVRLSNLKTSPQRRRP